ncbi:MAG: chromate transporter [Methanosarcinaceae archaeon]|nr:chromate transporter [Methanosarcinaceae archaeon]
MISLLDLYITFLKISSVTFGGGYAMLPILHKELVERKKWVDTDDLLNYYAIGQCTPGPIAINTSTLIGYQKRKLPGAIAATAGYVTPSFIIIIIIASVLQDISHLEIVNNAFGGIRVAVPALIIMAIAKLWKSSIKDGEGFLIFLGSFAISIFLNLSPIYVIIGAIILGLIMKRGEVPSKSCEIKSENSEKISQTQKKD